MTLGMKYMGSVIYLPGKCLNLVAKNWLKSSEWTLRICAQFPDQVNEQTHWLFLINICWPIDVRLQWGSAAAGRRSPVVKNRSHSSLRLLRGSFPYGGFPGGAGAKESACQCRDTRDAGSIPGLRISSGVGNRNPLQYSCLGKFHGQRSLLGYSPQGLKELDTTEHTLSLVEYRHGASVVAAHGLRSCGSQA